MTRSPDARTSTDSAPDDVTPSAGPQQQANAAARRQRSSRRRPLLLLALVVVLLLSGIGTLIYVLLDDGSAPARRAGAGPTVEVDLRPPSRRPEPSAAAKEPTEAGATAFALFYFDALNYSLANLDTDLLAGHTNAGCSQCTGYLIGIQRYKDQGARIEGGLTVPVDLAIGAFTPTEPVAFAATFLTTPASVKQKDGTAADFPGGRTKGGFTVLHANGQWQVTDLVLDATQAGPRP